MVLVLVCRMVCLICTSLWFTSPFCFFTSSRHRSFTASSRPFLSPASLAAQPWYSASSARVLMWDWKPFILITLFNRKLYRLENSMHTSCDVSCSGSFISGKDGSGTPIMFQNKDYMRESLSLVTWNILDTVLSIHQSYHT